MGDRYAKKAETHVGNAPLLGFLMGSEDSRAVLVRAGRAFQRFALTATAFGLGVQPVSEVVQVPALRQQLRTLANQEAASVLMFFRIGVLEETSAHHAPRHPVAAVVDAGHSDGKG